MKRKISVLLIVIMFLTGITGFAEMNVKSQVRAYLLADYETGEIIDGYNIEEVVEIASVSKLMSYMVIKDAIRAGELSLDDTIAIAEDDLKIGGSTINIKLGEIYSVDEALNYSLVISANNMTYALAKKVAGTEEEFVKLMNDKVKEIGLENSKFYNSSGLPVRELGVQNVMKVTDILTMSRYIIREYPEILERTSIPVVPGEIMVDGVIQDFIPTTNPLLGKVEGVDGLKTGYTGKAGYCLVSTFEKPAINEKEEKFRLISVVMGAETSEIRAEVCEKLVGHARDNFVKKNVLEEDVIVDVVPLKDKNFKEIEIFSKEEYKALIDESKDFNVNVKLNELMTTPARAGTRIGRIEVVQEGEVVFETDAIAKVTIREANFIVKFFRNIINLFRSADQVL